MNKPKTGDRARAKQRARTRMLKESIQPDLMCRPLTFGELRAIVKMHGRMLPRPN